MHPRRFDTARALSRSTLVVVAILVVGAASCGPPAAQLQEAYEPNPEGPTFNHSQLDAVVHEHVDADGWVDYAALAAEPGELDAYIAALAEAPFDELGRNEKLALLINAYNAFTLRLILDYYPLASIRDIASDQRWDGRTWNLGGQEWTLNEIEHEQIRPKFQEPRIHFAVNCASIGCPPLRVEAYVAVRIDEQLQDQMEYTHSHDRWLRVDAEQNTVYLTKLYDWYGGDFEQVADSVEAYAAKYSEPLRAALDSGRKPKTEWLDYDWTLNDVKNRPPS
jgi:hypothetical protein